MLESFKLNDDCDRDTRQTSFNLVLVAPSSNETEDDESNESNADKLGEYSK